MNLSHWFSYQLKADMEGFIWAVEQVTEERRTLLPPEPLGEWTVARHIFHLYFYEYSVSLFYIESWLKRETSYSGDFDEEKAWEETGKYLTIDQLLQKFQEVRTTQINLFPPIDENLWNEVCPTGFSSPRSLKWIVSKTYQHTAEHIHDVMRLALFWDSTIAHLQKEQQN